MGRKLSKGQRTKLREKHKKSKIKRLESLDRQGLSRKKYSFKMKPKRFFTLKIIGIISIPVVYFVYSPILFLVMIYFIAMFFFAIATEHSLNKSVIRSNHVKIPKYDSAIALVLLCVSFFGTIYSSAQTKIGMFTNTVSMQITQFFNNFGSLLTGRRTIFGSTRDFQFGSMERPDDFIANRADMMEKFGSMERPDGDFAGFAGRPPRVELNMDDLPIEFMFSQLLSTIATVLLVALGVFAIVSLISTIKKIKRFNEEQDEVIVDSKILILDDDLIEKVLDFGEIED